MAELINDYFDNNKKKKKNLPRTNEDPLQQLKLAMAKWNKAGDREVFNFRDITELEILTVIKELSNATTMGYDGLDSFTLKLVAGKVSKPIQHIVNLSLTSGNFLNKWKFGKLIPLKKSETADKMNAISYRPISILPVISKIAEKLAQSQIVEYMERKKLLNVHVFGHILIFLNTLKRGLFIPFDMIEFSDQAQ